MSTLRRRWRFTGTVQGVGFRYYARAAALHRDSITSATKQTPSTVARISIIRFPPPDPPFH